MSDRGKTPIQPIQKENRMISASELATAFPNVKSGTHPKGSRVLVQLRHVRQKTSGGIILAEETREFNKSGTQLAIVRELGPLAYKNRTNMEPWPEGTWVQEGELVRVPRYGGDRFERVDENGETTHFAIFMDHEIIATIDPDEFSALNDIR